MAFLDIEPKNGQRDIRMGEIAVMNLWIGVGTNDKLFPGHNFLLRKLGSTLEMICLE